LTLDRYATQLVLVQLVSLFIYFAAVVIFTDSPRRLRNLTRTIIIFGFVLAMFGLTQSLTSDGTRVYWFRQLTQSTAFGPFINRHHFKFGLPLFTRNFSCKHWHQRVYRQCAKWKINKRMACPL